MRQKPETRQTGAAKAIKDIRRAPRKQYSAEEKIRIVLDGLRGEETIAELCRREGITQSIYCKWSKEFLETGKNRWDSIFEFKKPLRGVWPAYLVPWPNYLYLWYALGHQNLNHVRDRVSSRPDRIL